MSKVYNFSKFIKKHRVQKERYRKELYASLNTLRDFYISVQDHMINLAVRDKWKEWNDTMEVGDVFNFSDEMLANTGDKNIDNLFMLWENIYDTIEIISKQNKIKPDRKTGGHKNTD